MGTVKFGLSDVHLSKLTRVTDDQTGVTEFRYAGPVALPGAVSLSLDIEGEQNVFYADNSQYAVFNTNNGFTGDLEIADLPDSILTGFMGYKTVTTGSGDSQTVDYVETADPATVEFAMICKISSNDKPDGITWYCCTFGRPSFEANTTTDSTDPDTVTVPITVSPIEVATGVIGTRAIRRNAAATYFTTAPSLPLTLDA